MKTSTIVIIAVLIAAAGGAWFFFFRGKTGTGRVKSTAPQGPDDVFRPAGPLEARPAPVAAIAAKRSSGGIFGKLTSFAQTGLDLFGQFKAQGGFKGFGGSASAG